MWLAQFFGLKPKPNPPDKFLDRTCNQKNQIYQTWKLKYDNFCATQIPLWQQLDSIFWFQVGIYEDCKALLLLHAWLLFNMWYEMAELDRSLTAIDWLPCLNAQRAAAPDSIATNNAIKDAASSSPTRAKDGKPPYRSIKIPLWPFPTFCSVLQTKSNLS